MVVEHRTQVGGVGSGRTQQTVAGNGNKQARQKQRQVVCGGTVVNRNGISVEW